MSPQKPAPVAEVASPAGDGRPVQPAPPPAPAPVPPRSKPLVAQGNAGEPRARPAAEREARPEPGAKVLDLSSFRGKKK